MKHQTTSSVLWLVIVSGLFLSQAPPGRGDDQGFKGKNPNVALTISRVQGTGQVQLTWDDAAIGLVLHSVAEFPLVGPPFNWTVVPDALFPITGAGTYLVPATDGSTFWELASRTPRAASSASTNEVDVPELEPGERIPLTGLRVVIQPESQYVEIGKSATWAALVDGFSTNSPVTFSWQMNNQPSTTVVGTTNLILTWRDLNLAQSSGYTNAPGSTNSNFFTIPSVTTNEVAYYRVVVTQGTNTAISDAAPLWAWESTNSVAAARSDPIVYGTLSRQSGNDACGSFSWRTDFGGHWPIQGSASYSASFSGLSPALYWHTYSSPWSWVCGTSITYPSVNVYTTYYFTTFSSSPVYTITLTGFN